VNRLTRQHRLDVAIEVVVDLKAMCLSIYVANRHVDGISLLNGDYGPGFRRSSMEDAVVESLDTGDNEIAVSRFAATCR